MWKVSGKVNNKLILALQIVLGIYLASLFFLQGIFYQLVYFRFGINISLENPFISFLILYLLTAPLAIITSNLLAKNSLQYDTALQAGLISNYTFVLAFAVPMLFADGINIFAFIGILFFASILGFAMCAISAVLYEKITLIKIRT
jgi:hypothetical protein